MDLKPLRELVAIDSPSGFTAKAAEYVFKYLKDLGWSPEYTNKGAVRCALGDKPELAIAAHIDTLGAVVSHIKSDGSLAISKVGGPSLHAYEGSYCRVYAMSGKVITGTLLLNNPAVHVNKEESSSKRDESSMHIRLDEEISNEKETRALGIDIGDFICFETHYEELPSGFVKSKFMDNKAGCMVLMELARKMKETGETAPVEIFFSNYEEVGHGGTVGYSEGIKEMLVIDMGVVGNDRSGKETLCSICAKDSSGPYDFEFRKTLTELAKKNNIPHAVDVYPYYGSDGSAALRAGNDFRVALIGPGVSASHGVERTHVKGIQATVNLCLAYIRR